jgi:hypothetical protein
MPAQPSWFPRLGEILAELRSLEQIPYLDRQAFERLFRVKDRRARVLMSRFGGLQIGNAWALERLELIQTLERIQRGEEFQWEQQRRQRVAAAYEQAKREYPARQVEIPVPRASQTQTFASLPSGIQLRPGELRIQFTNFEELLRHLVELGQALQNDLEQIRELLNP